MSRNVETIHTYYQKDHDRLDGLFQNYRKLKKSNYGEAKASFKEFKFGLERHIAWEEDILFPVFEQKSGVQGSGPTTVMRFEHVQIKSALNAIRNKVHENNPETDREETALIEVLTDHNAKEEGILYPMIDQFTSPEERNQIFEIMARNATSDGHGCCCGVH